jgi:hypothetical protein
MAKIHLSIEADSIEGLHDCLRNLLNGVYEVNTALPSQEWVYESAPDVIGTDTMPAPEKPKRGRKPKATTPEGQPEPATSPGDSVPPVVVAPGLPAAAASAPVQPVSAGRRRCGPQQRGRARGAQGRHRQGRPAGGDRPPPAVRHHAVLGP